MKRAFFITGIVLMLLLTACQDEPDYAQPAIELQGTAWNVLAVVKPFPETNYLQAPKPYRLHFASDTTYTLALDVNHCSGKWGKGVTGNSIDMGPAACTLICCDTDFANYFASALRNVNSYVANAENLVLRGQKGLKIRMERAGD